MTTQFAQLLGDEVVNVVVVPDSQSHRGSEYLSDDLSLGGEWVFTDPASENYASIGGLYNREIGRFSSPRPYPSWTFDWNSFTWLPPSPQPDGDFCWDETTLSWVPGSSPFPSWVWDGQYWQPPIPYPVGEGLYDWHEDTLSWVEVTA